MSDKKIRDILPPKEPSKSYVDFSKNGTEQEIKIKSTLRTKKRIGKKGLIFALLFFLVLSGTFCYFTLSRAEIEIWPETEVFTLETDLFFDKNVTRLLQKEKVLADIFQSSGRALKEEKAQGIIRVYNEASTSPQTLIATTRFVSADGKIFRIPVRVVIPGGTYEGSRFVPGEIDIKVVADEEGPEYNIGPTTFSIPGFAGTARYTKFYGKSFAPMQGGLREEVPKATKEDLNQAEDILSRRAKNECEELLKKELQPEEGEEDKSSSSPLVETQEIDYFLKDIRSEIIEKFSSTAPEDEVKEFNFQVKARCEMLFFEKEHLTNYVKELINEQIAKEKTLYEESLEITYFPESIDLDSGEISLSLSVSAKIYSEIDFYTLKNALIGKSLTEVKVFLENQPKILKTNVDFWPFWVRGVPDNPDKIDIFLRFDPIPF